MAIDQTLLSYATARQVEYLEAIETHGSERKAAEAMGVARGTLSNAIAALKAKAAKMGYSPSHDMTHVVPDGFLVKGVSTYYDDEGKPRGQWVKSIADNDARERILREFAESLAEGVKGLAPITTAPDRVLSDLMCVYPQGDPHVGLHSWWAEAGEDFDLKIAERLMCAAVDRLVSIAPAAETALLLNLGDMFHADNQRNESQSGHKLDVDGRWAKVQQIGLRAMLHCIRRMLEKHKRVIVRINRGNHDGHSSYALALMISCYFHNEPRVEVDLSPAVCWYHRFGSNLIGSTHGDTIKGPDMLPIMAADVPEMWGETKHRMWFVGHVHHQDLKEYRGGTVEYFRTLAARDAWHAGQGYRAGRDMRLIVLHRDHGEIERHRADIGMLEAA
ncbi:hypothetical protein [Paraburkholderia tropica]|uniref:hypothetical protein n=1 Tax=Paraburkholderia tropica TaxID=92647 RepID=UPI002AB798FF|nr:hypothetical protein [Paraburkholderia tropica]